MYATTPDAQVVVDKLQSYGVQCDGEVVAQAYHEGVDYAEEMTLAEVSAAKGRISRVRLLTEVWGGRGRIADISYIHATLPDGRTVPVRLSGMPTGSTGVPLRELKGAFIAWGREEGVFAKGLGLLDEGNWSVLR